MVYSFQGAGKTVFAAEANDHPALAPALFLNIEGGLLSVAYRGDVDYVDIRTTTELEQMLWDLATARHNPSSEWAGIKTIVIDSGTEVQTMNLEEIGAEATRKNSKHPKNELWPEDYQESTITLKRVFRMARDLPYNLIVTALPKIVYPRTAGNNRSQQVQSSQPTEISPWMTAKLAEAVMGYMDHVWYMWEDAAGRHMLTKSQGIYRCKTRGYNFAQRIGTVVNNPSLVELYDLFLESETGKPAVTRPGRKSIMEVNVIAAAAPATPNAEEIAENPELISLQGEDEGEEQSAMEEISA